MLEKFKIIVYPGFCNIFPPYDKGLLLTHDLLRSSSEVGDLFYFGPQTLRYIFEPH